MTSLDPAASPATLDRILRHRVGLNMPRALEVITGWQAPSGNWF